MNIIDPVEIVNLSMYAGDAVAEMFLLIVAVFITICKYLVIYSIKLINWIKRVNRKRRLKKKGYKSNITIKLNKND